MKKRFLKICAYLFTILTFITVMIVEVSAWTAPTIKETYVENEEEFRAVWVCTVSNMDMPKQIGTDDAAINKWKQNYLKVLDNALALGLNAIIFQVRPGNDAFYPSKYNPWSEYLAGFGIDPGWDPLAWMLEVTHEVGLEYHAWLNPYRASITPLSFDYIVTESSSGLPGIYNYDETALNNYKASYYKDLKNIAVANNTLVDNPIFYEGTKLNHAVVLGTEGKFVLNPADNDVQTHLNNTIKELVENYDLDGIHFDDYFYPNNVTYKGDMTPYKNMEFSTEPYVDYNDYQNYLANGGTLSIGNWRRANVDTLISNLSTIIRDINKTKTIPTAFGISPCTLWAPSPESCPVGSDRAAEGGINGGCNNYYAYSDLYANTYKWVKEGWIDYIVPQNYTNLGTALGGVPTGAYNTNNEWWSKAIEGYATKLYIGTALYQIEKWTAEDKGTTSEIFYQLKWNQKKQYNIDGYIYFRYQSAISGMGKNSANQVSKYLWKNFALTPTYEGYSYRKATESAKVKGLDKNADGSYSVLIDHVDVAKAYGVSDGEKVIARVNRNASGITFKAEEGKSYYLVTYGYDNLIHSDSQLIDLTKAYENQGPSIVFNTELKSSLYTGENIDLSFTVTDPENDKLTYSLVFESDSGNYTLISERELTSSTIEYTFDVYAVEMTNCKFILTVKDQSHENVFTSNTFDIIKQQVIQPTPMLYDIFYVTNGGVMPDSADTFYEQGMQVVLLNPTRSGYTFDGWYDNEEFAGNKVLEISDFETGNKTFYAKWIKNDEPIVEKKKKCGKKTGELIVSLLSCATLICIVLRKEEK